MTPSGFLVVILDIGSECQPNLFSRTEFQKIKHMKITSKCVEQKEMYPYPRHVKSIHTGTVLFLLTSSCAIVVQTSQSSSYVGEVFDKVTLDKKEWVPCPTITTFEC